jgi:hypothetical protein
MKFATHKVASRGGIVRFSYKRRILRTMSHGLAFVSLMSAGLS